MVSKLKSEQIHNILLQVSNNEGVNLEPYKKEGLLIDDLFNKLKNNKRVVNFVKYIGMESVEENLNAIIDKALASLDKPLIKNKYTPK